MTGKIIGERRHIPWREACLLFVCTVSCNEISSSTIHFIQKTNLQIVEAIELITEGTIALWFWCIFCWTALTDFFLLADWRRSCVVLLPDRVRQIRGLGCSILYRERVTCLELYVFMPCSTLSQGSNKVDEKSTELSVLEESSS